MEEKEKKERTVIHLYIKENDTQSASFEKEPFCQNRGIGAKNK